MWFLLVVVLVLFNASSAWATKYWVSIGAPDDSALCGSIAGSSDPAVYRKTVLGGWNCLSPGDTLHIKAGTYSGSNGNLNSPTLHNGTAGSPTIVEGEGIDVTIISNTFWYFGGSANSYVTFRDATLDGTGQPNGNDGMGLCNASGSNITLLRMKIVNYHGHGVQSLCPFTTIQYSELGFNGITGTNQDHNAYLHGTDVLFEHNYSHDARGGNGLQCYQSGSLDAARCIVRYNRFNANNDGMILDGADSEVYNNIVSNSTGPQGCGGCGIRWGYTEAPGAGAIRVQVHNNTVYGNAAQGIYVGIFGGGTDSVVKNNIVVNNNVQVFVTNGVTGVIQSNNACKTADACGSTGKLTITAITDCTVSTSDFTEKSSSTCINSGIIISGFPYNDTAPDIGAFEKQTLAVCTVEAGDASTLRATYNNAAFPPLLPATGITGFTSRKAGSNNPIVGGICHVTGTNRVDCPLTNAIIGSDAVDISYTTGSATPLTDSALISGTLNQPYPVTFSNQSCTNNVGAPSTYTFSQDKFEYHNLRGPESAPQLMPWTCPTCAANGTLENYANAEGFMPMRPGASIRIRISILNATADPPPTGFLFYYSRNAGAYILLPSTFGTDNVAYCGTGPDPDIPNNFAATTNQLSTSGTFAAGALLRSAAGVPSIDMALNGKTEMEACVTFNSTVSAGDTYAFRARRDDGTVLDTYTVTPTLQIQAISASGGF